MTVDAPALVVASADGRAVVAIRGGRATVFDTASLAVTATGAVADDVVAAALVATQLAVVHGGQLSTYELPGFELTASTAVPGATTIAGVAGDRVLLPIDGVVTIARLGPGAIALDQLAAAAPIEDVIALDGDRLLTIAQGAVAIVSVVSHRLLSRLSARVPAAPRMCGLAAGRRIAWLARADEPDLTLVRLSDGRTFGYRTAATIAGVYAHPEVPWVVVATTRGLERVHVQTLAGHPMAAELERGACVAGDDLPVLCWIDRQGRPRRTPLDGDAVVGPAGFRLAMAAGAMTTAAGAMMTAAGATTTAPRDDRPAAPARDDGPRPTVADEARPAAADEPAPPTPRVGRGPRARASGLWRVDLADWARTLLAGPDDLGPPPVLDDTPLGRLATRLALTDDGRRALAVLYGAWLAGVPRPSLDRLARTIAWSEVGGDGSLPAAAITTIAGGRIALRTAVARFLDGGAPARIALAGAGVAALPPRGRVRIHTDPDLPLATAARAIATHLGAAAITDEARAGGRRGLAIALDEAWLRQRPLIALPSGGFDVDALVAAPVRADHALIVVWPEREAPAALADWTALTLPT